MYNEQSALYMAAAAEWSGYYQMACQYAGRLQSSRRAGAYDQGLALYGIAYYIMIRRGEFVLREGYDERAGAYHRGLYFGKRYFII